MYEKIMANIFVQNIINKLEHDFGKLKKVGNGNSLFEIEIFGKFIIKSRKSACYRSITFKKMLTVVIFLEIPQNISTFVSPRCLPLMDLSVCNSAFWQV